MAELVPATLSHLHDNARTFFEDWIKKCGLETEAAPKKNTLKDLWTKTPEQREQASKAVARTKLQNPRARSSSSNGKYHVFLKQSGCSIKSSIFKTGDSVIVSSDSELALASGVITQISPTQILSLIHI